MENNTTTFGQRLKHLRINKNLTQEDLGVFLSVKKATISRYENDKLEVNLETVKKLAEYFNVTTDYLLCKDNQINSAKNNSIEGLYRQELIDEINTIIKKNSITEIKALRTILSSNYSLEDLRDTLINFEKTLLKKQGQE